MFDLSSISFDDFYFNGKWLSDFGGQICGQNGMSPFSVLPAKDIKTEKVLGMDGAFVYGATYQPRTFSIPVLFSDISLIRDISGWLNVKMPTDFYFSDDSVKIKVMFDSAIDIQAYALQGVVELKFIAHDPYFYALNEAPQVFTEGLFSVRNIGNSTSFPLIKIEGSGDIVMTINNTLIKIVGLTHPYMIIDCLNCTAYWGDISHPESCVDLSSKLFDPTIVTSVSLLTKFPNLDAGVNQVMINSGSVTKVTFTTRPRWI